MGLFLPLSTIQIRKLCKCEDCEHVFDIDAEVENENIQCIASECLSTNIVIIGTKVRKIKNPKRRG
jgi:hypothetical protein